MNTKMPSGSVIAADLHRVCPLPKASNPAKRGFW